MLVRQSSTILAVLAALLLSACGVPLQAHSYPPYPTTPAGPFMVGPDQVTVFYAGTAFAEIDKLLHHATRSIQLEMYEVGDRLLVQDLIDAHARGISTTLIVDPTVAVTAATEAWLRSDGISVYDYPVRARMIDHVKLLIVDGTTMVGGINWGSASDGNKDFDLEITGPAVTNLARVFEGDLVTCGVVSALEPAVPDPGVLVMATLPQVAIETQVLAALDGASSSVDLEMYTLTDSAVVHALTRASARGVSVRVLLDSSQATTNMNAYNQLVAGGVVPHWYVGPGLLHAKAAVIDSREVIVGSANWTASGFGHNHEVDVLVVSQQTAQAFETAISATWHWAR